MKKLSLFALLLVALCGLCYSAYAEEAAPPEVPKNITPKEAIAKFSPYIAICESGAVGATATATVAININGMDLRRPTTFSSGKSSSMALLVADDILMYPSESAGKTMFIVNRGGGEGEEQGTPVTIVLPNGAKTRGNEFGLYNAMSVAFAHVGLPADSGLTKFDLNDGATPEIGDSIYLVGRRGSEWKAAPFVMPAAITGELTEENRILFSISISQEQLSAEFLGAIAVTTTGKIIGMVNSVRNKTYSVVVIKPSDFAEAINLAVNLPDKLDKRTPGQALPGLPRDFIPPPPVPEPLEKPSAFLGISVGLVTPDKAKELGFDEPTGIIIEAVGEGSPAEVAGLLVGDVILEAGGLVVDSPGKLREILAKYNPEEELQLLVHREGKEFQVTVKLAQPK